MVIEIPKEQMDKIKNQEKEETKKPKIRTYPILLRVNLELINKLEDKRTETGLASINKLIIKIVEKYFQDKIEEPKSNKITLKPNLRPSPDHDYKLRLQKIFEEMEIEELKIRKKQ